MSVIEDQIAVMHPHDNRTWLGDLLRYVDITVDFATWRIGLVGISLSFGGGDGHVWFFANKSWCSSEGEFGGRAWLASVGHTIKMMRRWWGAILLRTALIAVFETWIPCCDTVFRSLVACRQPRYSVVSINAPHLKWRFPRTQCEVSVLEDTIAKLRFTPFQHHTTLSNFDL